MASEQRPFNRFPGKPSLGKQAFQLRGLGRIQTPELVTLLSFFKAAQVPIRYCTLLPDFSSTIAHQPIEDNPSVRVELQFELDEADTTFLNALKQYVGETLSTQFSEIDYQRL